MSTRTFEQYGKSGKIFTEINNLLKGRHPATLSEILHRDMEITKYMEVLSRAMQGATPDNIFIYGQTGTGKTITTKLVTAQLELDAGKKGIKIKTIYINCESVHSDIGILKQINAKIQPASALKRIVNSFDAYFTEFCAVMNELDGTPILLIIFDEVDKLAHPDILNIFARVKENGFLENNICLIGITNDLQFMETLDPRTKSVLSKSTIVFPPYTANQLRDILEQRAKTSFQGGALSEPVIPLCAAYAAQEHGDARRAIDLLRVSGEIAERQGTQQVLEEHVKKAKEEIEFDEVKEAIRTLPTHSKLVLASCAYHIQKGADVVLTGDMYGVYKLLCREKGYDPLTQRRVTDLLGTLAMLGLVDYKIINKGRYGRSKEVSLIIPMDIVKSAMEKENIFFKN